MVMLLHVIVSMLLSYFLSFGMTYLSNYKMLSLINENNFIVKDGDVSVLWEYLDTPHNKILFVLHQLPYFNMVATLIDTYINLANIDDIIEELYEANILDVMSDKEEKIYEQHNRGVNSIIAIHKEREANSSSEKHYQVEEFAFKESMLNNKEDYYRELELIQTSKANYQEKLALLRILKFCVSHGIDNLNIERLLKSIEDNDSIFYPCCYELFYLKDYLTTDNLIRIISFLNYLIDTPDLEEKYRIIIINEIHNSIFDKVDATPTKNLKDIIIRFGLDPEDKISPTLTFLRKEKKKDRRK